MKCGAMAHGGKVLRNCNNAAMIGRQFAAVPVGIVDSILIVDELDTSKVLAEWIAKGPNISICGDLGASRAVKLFLNWTDRNGAIDLRQGDHFTFTVPDIFVHDYIANVSGVPITNTAGEVVANYSIYDNSTGMKEVRITFTDYVENHTGIYGDFWMLLHVRSAAATEPRALRYVVNDLLVAQGRIAAHPHSGLRIPSDRKLGLCSPTMSADGYHIFEWHIQINMGENAVNGFDTLGDFSFEDVIPADSPHVFLTNAIRQELGLSPTAYAARIGEYTGADSVPPWSRYPVFLNQYNGTDASIWHNFVQWHPLVDGLTSVGICGNAGLRVSGIEVAENMFSANLGTLTRPVVIVLYTVSSIRISESALGDREVVSRYRNLFKGSNGDNLSASVSVYRFGTGGSAQGITGEFRFAFAKVDGDGAGLPGAMFSLYTSGDLAAGADRFVFSGNDGTVTFDKLPAGTFYLQESAPPYGYLPNDTVYRVVLSGGGFEIYYGPNFEYRLSDLGNRIANRPVFEAEPALVVLAGRKNLTGSALEGGMFSFIARDSQGVAVATGTNNADGGIEFSSIELGEPGVYTFTVEEVRGTDSGIIFDNAIFSVTVTVTSDGSGNLTAEVAYPDGGIVFNNQNGAAFVPVVLQAKKQLNGASLTSGMFHFVARDVGGNTIAVGSNGADGSILFSSIVFDKPGVYTFAVEEMKDANCAIIYDDSVFPVTVTVAINAGGYMIAEVTYPNDGIVFNNRYVTAPVEPPCQCYAARCANTGR